MKEIIQRLKKENEELKELNTKICEDWENIIKYYWSVLKEIREIAMGIMDDDVEETSSYYDANLIINKINEVLDE